MTYKLNNSNFFMSIDTAVPDGSIANSEATIYLNTTSKDVVMRYRDDVGALRTSVIGEANPYGDGHVLFGDTDGSIASSSDFSWDSTNKVFTAGNGLSTTATNAAMVGGTGHTLGSGASNSAIVGGDTSTMTAGSGTVMLGGLNHTHTAGNNNFVIGGSTHTLTLSTQGGVLGGNLNNIVNGQNTCVIGGETATIGATSQVRSSVIAGGILNTIDVHDYAFIGGGNSNTLSGAFSSGAAIGGNNLVVNQSNAVAIGGARNTVSANRCAVLAGENHDITAGIDSVILGGARNTISNSRSCILAGVDNVVSGQFSIAGGTDATVSNNYSFFLNLDSGTTPRTNSTAGSFAVFASGGSIFGSPTPVASAELAVDSTTKGFRLPKMTTTQMNAISAPDSGLQIFDTTTNQFMAYNGSAWVILG